MRLPRSILPRHKGDSQYSKLLGVGQLLGVALLIVSLAFNLYLLQLPRLQSDDYERTPLGRDSAPGEPDTLVIYVFRNTDPEALNNLFFFLENGVKADDGARYVIAMDPSLPEQETPVLPSLPPNAEFVRPATCFEAGVVGWLLHTSGRIDVSKYRYFVWISSSARGPFLAAHQRESWHTLLTERLSPTTRLVGATISCSRLIIDKALAAMEHPHVQGYAVATDKRGIELLRGVGALDCHNNWKDNIRYAEFAAAAAVLNAGFNLDCLMLRYQGLDWRNRTHWGCNARIDPLQPGVYDGTTVNPLEVLFVRTDFAGLLTHVEHMTQAAAYTRWAGELRDRQAVTSNAWAQTSPRLRQSVLERPQACFDAETYRMGSSEEFRGYSSEQLYEHFKAFGLREGRPYSFLC